MIALLLIFLIVNPETERFEFASVGRIEEEVDEEFDFERAMVKESPRDSEWREIINYKLPYNLFEHHKEMLYHERVTENLMIL